MHKIFPQNNVMQLTRLLLVPKVLGLFLVSSVLEWQTPVDSGCLAHRRLRKLLTVMKNRLLLVRVNLFGPSHTP